MNRKLTLLWEMEVSEDLQHASLIHWQLLRFQHGVMVLDTIMVYLNNWLKMDIKLKFQIFGWRKEIHGKSKDKMLLIMLDFMVIQKSIWMETQKDLIGKDVRKLSQWLMIHQFQDLILTTQTISDFGDQDQEIILILINSIRVTIMEQFKKDKMLSI